jgi:hypothetical protein
MEPGASCMRIARRSAKAERASIDHEAIRLMLSYVEAECLRIGATDAARHAALAAALVPGGQPAAAAAAASRRPRADRLH